MKKAIAMPGGLKYWTADQAAECLSYQKHLPKDYLGGWLELYTKLWGFLDDAKNRTPLGGDGSNGTVETPDGLLDLDNDDKALHWWGKLDAIEQKAIALAYEDETD